MTPQTLSCQAGNAAVGMAVGSFETGEKALGVRQSSWVRGGLRWWDAERRRERKVHVLLSKAEAEGTPACRDPHLLGMAGSMAAPKDTHTS